MEIKPHTKKDLKRSRSLFQPSVFHHGVFEAVHGTDSEDVENQETPPETDKVKDKDGTCEEERRVDELLDPNTGILSSYKGGGISLSPQLSIDCVIL